ncbi:MAG: lipopolysaccharide export system protein LptA [Planctomycetota bacterium]
MRRYLLIALMFVPIVAAWFLFQELNQESQKGIKRVEKANIKASRASAAEALTGFEGKGTFYRHLARIAVGRQDKSYASAYYYLNQWRRDEADNFWIDGLLVVRNPRPRTPEDFDGLLQISNAESSVRRRTLLEEARHKYNSLFATKAKASGGKNVTGSDHFFLSEGVDAVIPNKDKKVEPYRVTTRDAELKLADGDLDTLLMPGPFTINTPTHTITGIGMEGRGDNSRLLINKDPLITSVAETSGKKPSAETVKGNGPLIWQPDDIVQGEPRTILNRARFDFGYVEIFDDVEVKMDVITIRGDELSARIGNEDKVADPGRLVQLTVRGNVVVKTNRGDISGDEARVVFDNNGGAVIEVEGEEVSLNWAELALAKDGKKKKTLNARATGHLHVRVPNKSERAAKSLEITMDDNVKLHVTDKTNPIDIEGENLVVNFKYLTLEGADPTEDSTAWRLESATMRGHVEGEVKTLNFKSTKLTIDRRYEANGILNSDLLTLEGPAEITRPGGIGRESNSPDLKTTLNAKRRITYILPASPFAVSTAVAEGQVTALESGAKDKNRKLSADWLEIVLPSSESKSQTANSIEAKGSVEVTDEKGSNVLADRVWMDTVKGYAEAEGAPARITFVNKNNQKQLLRAPRILLYSDQSKLEALGGFDGRLYFPTVVLNSDKKEKKDKDPVDREWEISGKDMWAVFGGHMPLSTKEKTDTDPIRLLEANLTGRVRVQNPDQILTGNNLNYDFRSKSGTMIGEPARLVSLREIEGVLLKDWIEAPKVLTQPEWTLFEGLSKARLNIKRQSKSKRDQSTWETLRVDCSKDILIRRDSATFNGRCLLERGVVATGGLRLEADHAIATFSKNEPGSSRPQQLEKIEASGDVSIARDKLRGSGEFLDFDYVENKAIMTGDGKPCRMWMDSRGLQVEGQSVGYDLTEKTITLLKAFGTTTRKEGNN